MECHTYKDLREKYICYNDDLDVIKSTWFDLFNDPNYDRINRICLFLKLVIERWNAR